MCFLCCTDAFMWSICPLSFMWSICPLPFMWSICPLSLLIPEANGVLSRMSFPHTCLARSEFSVFRHCLEVFGPLGMDRCGFTFILLHMHITLPQHHLLRMLFSPLHFWGTFVKYQVVLLTRLCLALLFCSTDLHCLLLYQYQAVLLLQLWNIA